MRWEFGFADGVRMDSFELGPCVWMKREVVLESSCAKKSPDHGDHKSRIVEEPPMLLWLPDSNFASP